MHFKMQTHRSYFAKLSKSVLTLSSIGETRQNEDLSTLSNLSGIPICAQTISVNAPMNCGVALTPNLSVSSSTILPMENQRADLRRYEKT